MFSTHDIHHDDDTYSMTTLKAQMPSFPGAAPGGCALPVGRRGDLRHAGTLHPARQDHDRLKGDSCGGLSGKTFIVAGGATGIGAGTAKRLAADHAVGRDKTLLDNGQTCYVGGASHVGQ